MTAYYVRSGAAGAGTGADWANAFTTLTLAVAGKANGDTFYVSEDHAETTAGAVTITVVSTLATPSFIYCVNHAGSVPPVSADLRTTGSVATTGTSALTITGNGIYVYGLIFSCGTTGAPALNAGTSNTSFANFINCTFVLNSGGSQNLLAGGANGTTMFDNCTLQVTAVGGTINNASAGRLIWKNTPSAIAGATIPTRLFTQCNNVLCQGVDFSALGSGKELAGAGGGQSNYIFVDCKLGASVTLGTPTGPGNTLDLVRCDSGATNYRNERYRYQGTQIVETTIVRTGGATDGTTLQSWKLTTTANSKWINHFESEPIIIWNDSTSAITTLTIYGTTTGGGVPKDDEIWVEVEYLGSALTPQGSFKTSTKADNLAASAATNNSSDASTWAGSGAGNGFKIVVPSFTPGMKGPINITVKAAKASTTYYIDPKPSISGVTVSKSEILAFGVYANELSSGSGSSSIIGG